MKSLEIQKFDELSYLVQESVNTLCTNLSFSGENVHKIMLTSVYASEGKSFLCMNIVRTMAGYGKRVVLVDADLRCSSIIEEFGLKFEEQSPKHGLAHYLAGMTEVENVIYRTNLPGVYLVPIGRIVPNPLPLLNSRRFRDLLDALASNFDYVIVDVPPIGTVIDAAEVAKNCDGTLLVVGYNSVRPKELAEVTVQLEQTGCPIIGAVLNRVKFDNYLNRKYYYRSLYSQNGEEKPKKKHRKAKDC